MSDIFSINVNQNITGQYRRQIERKLSDKDTNEDSDEDKNQNLQTYFTQYPLKQIKQKGNKNLKNELCKNHLRYGNCHYGFRCQFAHGIDELRKNSNQNSKYKTKQCSAYFNDGCCMYGSRCNFRHIQKQKEQKKQKTTICLIKLIKDYPQLLVLERSRLKFFESFEEKF